MDFQAVIFDFDGVLAHTIPIYKKAIFQFFKEQKIHVPEEDFESGGWASKSLKQFCEILRTKYDFHIEVPDLQKQIWQTQVDLINIGLESDPSLIPFLMYCQEKNIKVGIGSNSGRERIEWVIKKMNIDTYFLYETEHPEKWYNIVGVNDLIHHKPDPEVWIKCSEILEVSLADCLVIEDGLPGLTGAKACGARGIYYQRFCRPEKACREISERTVESFSELFE